jgi:hypothetical protein
MTEERPYPPEAFDSSTSETSSSEEMLNIIPSNYI